MFNKLNLWTKSIEHRLDKAWGYDFSTPEGRRRARWHFMLVDHGFLRVIWANLDQISPGIWRSNQPSPRRVEKYKSMGIRTIINLRGTNKRSNFMFEKQACEHHGIKMVNIALKASGLVPADRLLKLLDCFDTVEKPLLMHCKSGADRAGLASALYLLHVDKTPVSIAKKQLSLRYIHLKSMDTGILDHMIEAYGADSRNGEMPIREWIETKYDPEALSAAFRKSRKSG